MVGFFFPLVLVQFVNFENASSLFIGCKHLLLTTMKLIECMEMNESFLMKFPMFLRPIFITVPLI